MPEGSDRRVTGKTWVTRITTGIAALTALLIATLLPVTYYELRVGYYHGKLEADARNISFRLTQIVSTDPVMWRFRADLLGEILGRFVDVDEAEQLEILAYAADELVAQKATAGQPVSGSWPVVMHGYPIYDSGQPVGWVELRASLRSTIIETAILSVVMGALGLIAFVLLRRVPLRALDRALNEVTYLASHDPLTNLPNRSLFRDRLQQALSLAERRSDKVAILCLDLDHFKDVNDTLGHAAGDALLRQVTERVQGLLRTSDTLARLGGDEFALIQGEVEEIDSAAVLAQRIIDALTEAFDIQGNEVIIGCSVGIALYPVDQLDADELLRSADLALYRAKADGRGVYRFFEENMNAKLRERKTLEADLRRALVEGQFELYYQPQVDLGGEVVKGVEALIRWHHPVRGLVSPTDFIPLAEESGIIIPITAWALRRACVQTREWREFSVAVNLSPVMFKHPDLVGLVAEILKETGFDAHRLELEITETSLLQDTDRTLATLDAMSELGIRIAMDDFGTGYSSLSYLQRFPFDKIKIDRSFVSKLSEDPNAAAIVRAVINLGRSLGMVTTAEGVETNDQLALLVGQGCKEVQGFYYARPMPAADMNLMISAAGAGNDVVVHRDPPKESSTAA